MQLVRICPSSRLSSAPLLTFHLIYSVNVDRSTTKDITLSDGTHLPKGTFISAAVAHIMRDKDNFGEDADKFNGFRFSDRRAQQGQENKHQIVQISSDFLSFGMGRRAW